MRRALSVALILSIVLIASVYSAFSANLNATRMKVDISFPFYVGAEQHPAGNTGLKHGIGITARLPVRIGHPEPGWIRIPFPADALHRFQ